LSEFSTILTVGGDGTFLKAASMIVRSDVLLAGVNSDPLNSAGVLCSLSQDRPAIHAFVDSVAQRSYKPLLRSRLHCTLSDFAPASSGTAIHEAASAAESTTKLPLALNEVFIACNDPSAVSHFAVSVDGAAEFECKNSGILMSTGTGSAGWSANALENLFY
jgi:NAD+ kinase